MTSEGPYPSGHEPGDGSPGAARPANQPYEAYPPQADGEYPRDAPTGRFTPPDRVSPPPSGFGNYPPSQTPQPGGTYGAPAAGSTYGNPAGGSTYGAPAASSGSTYGSPGGVYGAPPPSEPVSGSPSPDGGYSNAGGFAPTGYVTPGGGDPTTFAPGGYAAPPSSSPPASSGGPSGFAPGGYGAPNSPYAPSSGAPSNPFAPSSPSGVSSSPPGVYGAAAGTYGSQAGAGSGQPGDTGAPPPKKKRGLMIGLIGAAAVVVLLAIGGVAYAFMGGGSYAVGSCVRKNGTEATSVACSTSGAYKVTKKVSDWHQCDQTQPYVTLSKSGSDDQYLCLTPTK
jgi:hypothetical protein